MAKACIVYFSQTGNTEQVAYTIAGKLASEGMEVITILLCDVEDFPEALEGIDMLGVGFPTFFGYPPPNMMKFIESLQNGNGRSAFVFTTYGGLTAGDSLYDAANALAAKGYRILGGLKVEGKDNYPQSSDLRINERRPDEVDLARSEEFALRIVHAHMSGSSLDPGMLASSTKYFIEHRHQPRKLTVAGMRKNIEGRIVFHTDRCLFCESCKRSCPTKSIATGEKFPVFSWKCMDGMRCFQCVRTCPGKALTIDYPTPPEIYKKYRDLVADSDEEKRIVYKVA